MRFLGIMRRWRATWLMNRISGGVLRVGMRRRSRSRHKIDEFGVWYFDIRIEGTASNRVEALSSRYVTKGLELSRRIGVFKGNAGATFWPRWVLTSIGDSTDWVSRVQQVPGNERFAVAGRPYEIPKIFCVVSGLHVCGELFARTG